jgi:hypothetical protein
LRELHNSSADRTKREEFSARFAAITECDQGLGLKREGLIFSRCANYIIHQPIAPSEKILALVSAIVPEICAVVTLGIGVK